MCVCAFDPITITFIKIMTTLSIIIIISFISSDNEKK
jgi:hypothetical protein